MIGVAVSLEELEDEWGVAATTTVGTVGVMVGAVTGVGRRWSHSLASPDTKRSASGPAAI
jgi:hypothetical protein